MTNMNQFSHSVTDLPKVIQIPCDTLEQHKVCPALCLGVSYLLAQYTSTQVWFSILSSMVGRRTGAVSLPLLYIELFSPGQSNSLLLDNLIQGSFTARVSQSGLGGTQETLSAVQEKELNKAFSINGPEQPRPLKLPEQTSPEY